MSIANVLLVRLYTCTEHVATHAAQWLVLSILNSSVFYRGAIFRQQSALRHTEKHRCTTVCRKLMIATITTIFFYLSYNNARYNGLYLFSCKGDCDKFFDWSVTIKRVTVATNCVTQSVCIVSRHGHSILVTCQPMLPLTNLIIYSFS